MKIFVVHLKNGNEIEIEATSYSRDNEQYVFVVKMAKKFHLLFAPKSFQSPNTNKRAVNLEAASKYGLVG